MICGRRGYSFVPSRRYPSEKMCSTTTRCCGSESAGRASHTTIRRSSMNQPSRLPLSGITVVSLEQAIAAPLASRHLADWGARVIKIERPGKGDFCRDYDYVMNGMSSQFAWTNRSKESLALDVKSSEGKRVVDALLPQADVFLQNLAPGAAKRLGLDGPTLVERFPRLIACEISGYGSGGPYSQ